MAKISVLVETDTFIDYFNASRFHALFDSTRFTAYYSMVTKKDLLTKSSLRDAERESILAELNRCRRIPLSDSIADLLLRQPPAGGLAPRTLHVL
ncbi:MAG: hypothetical protein ABI988_13575 [Nitrospirota bacterium]